MNCEKGITINSAVSRQAYLIAAHKNPCQLKALIQCLDHPDVDIYLHVDKKANWDGELFRSSIHCARLFLIPRVPVTWGGYSQIVCEINLLAAAVENGPYLYYHFLSGQDLPLRKQEEILTFFKRHAGIEFISMGDEIPIENAWYKDRIIYYYPFYELMGRSPVKRIWKRGWIEVQRLLHANRLKNSKSLFSIGSAYFDITDDFASFVLSKREEIRTVFHSTYCADEIFLQWCYIQWPERHQHERYRSSNIHDLYITSTYTDVVRAIDWKRGNPYVFRIDDFQMLMDSGCLFARKFDENVDNEIIKKIVMGSSK